MSNLISREEGAIFDVYRLILEDPAIIQQIEAQIRKENYVAEYAVRLVFEQYLSSISQIQDEYLRERTGDVKDAAQRLSRKPCPGHPTSTLRCRAMPCWWRKIYRPADLSMLEGDHFRGIVLSTGGVTTHASILAKSFEIPSVVAIEGLMDIVHQGDCRHRRWQFRCALRQSESGSRP